MTGYGVAPLLIVAMVGLSAGPAPSTPADGPGLTGRWTLNKSLSQIPPEVGFGMDLAAGAGASSDAGDRSGGGGGGAAVANMVLFRESADDSKRRDQLVEDVRTPSTHLTIAQADTTVTIVADRGLPRTFHGDGRTESIALDDVSVMTTSKWDGARLEVRYRVEQNRELRYTYSRTADPPRLSVQVRFIERGDRLTATFVYEPAKPNEPAAAPPPTMAAPGGLSGLPPAVRAPGLNPPVAAAAPPAPVSAATRPVGAPRP